MQPKVGLVLLSWSAISAMLTVYAFMIPSHPQGLIDKSLVPQTNSIVEGGALDDAKLEAQCKQEYRDAPERDLQDRYGAWSLARWMAGGAGRIVSQMVAPMAWGLAAGTVVSAACGIACTRKPAAA